MRLRLLCSAVHVQMEKIAEGTQSGLTIYRISLQAWYVVKKHAPCSPNEVAADCVPPDCICTLMFLCLSAALLNTSVLHASC